MPEEYPLFDHLLSWEKGELDEAEELELFKQLVNSGLIFQLQGMYGRRARDLGLL